MKNGFLTFKSLRSGSRMKRKKETKKLEKTALAGKKRSEMKNRAKFCAAIKNLEGSI